MRLHKNLSLVHVSIVAVLLTALLGSTGWAETNFIGFTHIFKWVVTEDASDSTSSEEFINLPNADAFAFVPDAGGLINVRFTAESACSGGLSPLSFGSEGVPFPEPASASRWLEGTWRRARLDCQRWLPRLGVVSV